MESLVDLCCQTLAAQLATGLLEGPPVHILGRLPEPELSLQVFKSYRRQVPFQGVPCCDAQRQLGPDSLSVWQELQVLIAFAATCWQPKALNLHGLTWLHSPQALSGLAHSSHHLKHFQLTHATSLTDLSWLQCLQQPAPSFTSCSPAPSHPQPSPTPGPPSQSHQQNLTCLSLRGCTAFRTDQLVHLAALPGLVSLDLSSCSQLGQEDGLAWNLLSLTRLQAMNLSHTQVGDAVLEALTWGNRMRQWAQQTGAVAPPSSQPFSAETGWPRCVVHHWELAGTRVTGAGIAHLAAQPNLSLLDVRHTQVRRADLARLERAFPTLHLAQGSVLTHSLAVAAAVCNHAQFTCTCPVRSHEYEQPQAEGTPAGTGQLGQGRVRARDAQAGQGLRRPKKLHNLSNPQWQEAWELEGLLQLTATAQRYLSSKGCH